MGRTKSYGFRSLALGHVYFLGDIPSENWQSKVNFKAVDTFCFKCDIVTYKMEFGSVPKFTSAVSNFFQVGLPSSREQYIHRLGRTARAGKQGHGIILLAPFEKVHMKITWCLQ